MPIDDRGVVTPRLLVGICILIVGSLLLLDNLQLFEARTILRFWPVALVAIGVLVFSQAVDTGGRVNGGALVLFGTFLTLTRLGAVEVNFWQLFWPLVLILLGVNLVMQTFRIQRPQSADAGDTVSLFAVLGGSQRTSNSARFRGGDMTAFMGGCELDLRQAAIEPGGVATIDVLAVMGGHDIRVPENWSVVTRVVPFMGGIEDKRTGPKAGASATLVLRGFVMMGGLEIKN
jgi:predicted membrane protein